MFGGHPDFVAREPNQVVLVENEVTMSEDKFFFKNLPFGVRNI
jgi:hypothetical protein